MRDRSPTKPNRMLVIPENGSAYYAEITRADEPTDTGTPLNKATFLSDDTAKELELSGDPVPSQALVQVWDAAMRADGLTRAIALDANVNDTSNRSAIGEYTRYMDTYGLGYALCFYGGVTKDQDFIPLSKCKNRREIANSVEALNVMGKYDKLKTLWRAYLYLLRGKYRVDKTLLGTVGSTSGTGEAVRNPVNGYMYTKVGNSLYVSTDNGSTWKAMMYGTNTITLNQGWAFSSDYKYVYGYYDQGKDNGWDLYISTNGTTFDISLYVKLRYGHVNQGMLKCGTYYYYGYSIYPGNAYNSSYLNKCDGKSLGSEVKRITYRYSEFTNQLKVGSGGVFIWTDTSNYSDSMSYSGFFAVFNDEVSEYKVSAIGNSPGSSYQYDLEGNLYVQLTVNSTSAYYKIATNGTVTQLADKSKFPAPNAGSFGQQYQVPLGQKYKLNLHIGGGTVSDNYGEFTGTQIVPAISDLEYVKDNTVTWYTYEDGKVYKNVGVFEDEEAQ